MTPQQQLELRIHRESGEVEYRKADCLINTEIELEYYRSGGILQYVLNNMVSESK